MGGVRAPHTHRYAHAQKYSGARNYYLSGHSRTAVLLRVQTIPPLCRALNRILSERECAGYLGGERKQRILRSSPRASCMLVVAKGGV